MIGILVIALVIGVMIVGHAISHYLFARLFRMPTPILGLGLPFGPHWTIGKKWGTEFRIHLLLFGGYVCIPALGVATTDDAQHSRFPLWKQIIVVLSGGIPYMLTGWLVMYLSIAFIGIPHYAVNVEGLPPNIDIATKAGVKLKDKILSIDKQNVEYSVDVVNYLRTHPSTPVTLSIKRGSDVLDISMTTDPEGKVGMFLTEQLSGFRSVNPIEAVSIGTSQTIALTSKILGTIGPAISIAFNPSHPRGIEIIGTADFIKLAGNVAKNDWRQLPMLVIMLNIDMAIINLIPWPGFDGGHLVAVIVNAVRKKPLPQSKWITTGFIGAILYLLVKGCPVCLVNSRTPR